MSEKSQAVGYFKKIKKQSIVIMILGALTTIYGYMSYQDANEGMMILGETKLGEGMLK